jgi:mono/diheme cytochrome c family protein
MRVFVLFALAAVLASASPVYALTARSAAGPTGAPTTLKTGKRLYRKYCGQCHSLTAALAAGFGSENGLGTNGGPSFDNLRVRFNLSVLSITLPFIGHEVLVHKMTWTQIREVSSFLETATKHNSMLAQAVDG